MITDEIQTYGVLQTRMNLPSILDMCFLAGKICEDPEKDAGLQCTLPEGTEVFQNCSTSFLRAWNQYSKEYEKDKVKAAFDVLKSAFVTAKDSLTTPMHEISEAVAMARGHSEAAHESFQEIESKLRNDYDEFGQNIKDAANSYNPFEFKDSTGLKIALYTNNQYRCSVLAVRGTVPAEMATLFADGTYSLNIVPEMYFQAKDFYRRVRACGIFKDYPLVACTGHSLGGIIAKMLAPITGVSTYAFNSPGVLQIPLNGHLPIRIKPNQEILTYVAAADPTGHFREDQDLGTPNKNHIYLPVLGGNMIVSGSVTKRDSFDSKKDYGLVDRVLSATTGFKKHVSVNDDYLDAWKKNSLTYHGILEMFNYMKTSTDKRSFTSRLVKLSEIN